MNFMKFCLKICRKPWLNHFLRFWTIFHEKTFLCIIYKLFLKRCLQWPNTKKITDIIIIILKKWGNVPIVRRLALMNQFSTVCENHIIDISEFDVIQRIVYLAVADQQQSKSSRKCKKYFEAPHWKSSYIRHIKN